MRHLRSAVFAFAALLTVCGSGPPHAAERPREAADLRNMDLTSTAVPVVWQGRLLNYVFVKLRLRLAPGRSSLDYHPRQPYLRDALVRDAHRTPFVRPGDFNHVDEAALKRTVLAEADRLLGKGIVTGVIVTSQTPARIVRAPPSSPAARSPIP